MTLKEAYERQEKIREIRNKISFMERLLQEGGYNVDIWDWDIIEYTRTLNKLKNIMRRNGWEYEIDETKKIPKRGGILGLLTSPLRVHTSTIYYKVNGKIYKATHTLRRRSEPEWCDGDSL